MPADGSGTTTDHDQSSDLGASDGPTSADPAGDGRRSASAPASTVRRPGEIAGRPEGVADPGGNGVPASSPAYQARPTAAPSASPIPPAPRTETTRAGPDTRLAAPLDRTEAGGPGETTSDPFAFDPRPELGPAGLVPSPEPPPAPVLTAPPARLGRPRRVRGRHASTRRDRASRRGLRVNQRLWTIDPWSVFKVSALFYLCLGLIVVVAGTLLYNAGRSVGTIDQFESFVTRIGAYGQCTPKAEVPEGTEFEEDDKCGEGEVLVGGFALDDGTLFRSGAIAVALLVVAGSIGNVLLVVLVNLLNELTGGLRHTIIKEPVARPSAGVPARPRRPAEWPPSRSPGGRHEG